MSGFMETVQNDCHCPVHNVDPFWCLDWLFRNTAQFLKSWSRCCVGNVRIHLKVVKEVVLQLEKDRDRRLLAGHEEALQ
jgi:hypothetical protein